MPTAESPGGIAFALAQAGTLEMKKMHAGNAVTVAAGALAVAISWTARRTLARSLETKRPRVSQRAAADPV